MCVQSFVHVDVAIAVEHVDHNRRVLVGGRGVVVGRRCIIHLRNVNGERARIRYARFVLHRVDKAVRAVEVLERNIRHVAARVNRRRAMRSRGRDGQREHIRVGIDVHIAHEQRFAGRHDGRVFVDVQCLVVGDRVVVDRGNRHLEGLGVFSAVGILEQQRDRRCAVLVVLGVDGDRPRTVGALCNRHVRGGDQARVRAVLHGDGKIILRRLHVVHGDIDRTVCSVFGEIYVGRHCRKHRQVVDRDDRHGQLGA